LRDPIDHTYARLVSDGLIVVDTSEIREGRLEELRAAVAEMASFVEEHEPDPISYQVFFSADGRRMTVVQIHRDSASMERHMEVARAAFAPFAELLELRTVDVYGEPSARVIDLLRRKAEMLGTAPVEVHDLQAGFARMEAPVEVVAPPT
jgi:quinol monooxygenase YgiN